MGFFSLQRRRKDSTERGARPGAASLPAASGAHVLAQQREVGAVSAEEHRLGGMSPALINKSTELWVRPQL